MLRVGLTGDLGSGKSTVARLLASHGAIVFSSDEMARAMMQPGEPVYRTIVERFGQAVIAGDASLDRQRLAKLAFDGGRVEELNTIVHPAVLREQAKVLEALAHAQPHAIAVVESALLFTTKHGVEGQSWHTRFDRIVLVTAPDDVKIERFVQRMSAGHVPGNARRAALESDARSRLALQTERNNAHAGECLVVENGGDLDALGEQVGHVWAQLQEAEAAGR